MVAAGVLTTGGFALGADSSDLRGEPGIEMTAAACDAMHRSAKMQRMLGRIPAELREGCEAMHERMVPMMKMMQEMSCMMSDSGMMDGS